MELGDTGFELEGAWNKKITGLATNTRSIETQLNDVCLLATLTTIVNIQASGVGSQPLILASS